MTFLYDEKIKNVFLIQPATFNYFDKFAEGLTDTLNKTEHPKHIDPQFSISIKKNVKD